ncbi:MAG: SMI1/KNR4 family protein [Lachnospiraceae bacterium]|nr:SMI1/KNR4 family protein [Lachnospiraceae bacterium]
MADITWKYVSPLKDESELEALELKYCYKLPEDLKTCIIENNAGTPSLVTFDMGENKRMVFGGLLSFNKDDMDSIYDFICLFETDGGKKLKMFPFGIDPAGNFLCIKEGNIVFYNHEEDRSIFICKTFTDFLNMLYK